MVDVGRRRGQTFTRVSRSKGSVELSLGKVLFPLRYDIYVMAQFLQYYEENRHLDVDALIEDPPPYMVQRIDIMHDLRRVWGFLTPLPHAKYLRRKKKYVGGNIRVLIGLWNIVRREGYLGTGKGHMTLKIPVDNALTLAGNKLPLDTYHLTNGQHRMVMLLAIGKRVIPPHWYDVVRVKNFRPIESTGEYVKRHQITEAQFVDFARLRFDVPEDIETISTFRDWASETSQPDWLLYYLDLYWGRGGEQHAA